eukprot:8338774-Alexandrium_andersonii.AAC.1
MDGSMVLSRSMRVVISLIRRLKDTKAPPNLRCVRICLWGFACLPSTDRSATPTNKNRFTHTRNQTG